MEKHITGTEDCIKIANSEGYKLTMKIGADILREAEKSKGGKK